MHVHRDGLAHYVRNKRTETALIAHFISLFNCGRFCIYVGLHLLCTEKSKVDAQHLAFICYCRQCTALFFNISVLKAKGSRATNTVQDCLILTGFGSKNRYETVLIIDPFLIFVRFGIDKNTLALFDKKRYSNG